MPAPLRWILALVLLVLPALAPGAERTPADAAVPPAAASDVDDAPGQTAFAPTRPTLRDPFAVRVRELGVRREAALGELRARLAATPPEGRAAVQREIEAVKLAWSAELLGAQIERARATGRAALAARLERRLAVLREAAPAARLAPAGGAR